jgi:hypothetical protein
MLWLPDYGVGVVVFGNVTYTPWGRVVPRALDILAGTGGLQPRMVQPSRALVMARNAVSQLIVRWDAALAQSIAADNLFRDESSARREAQLEALRKKVGSCSLDRDRFDNVENALRGQWTVQCERGRLLAAITLAPTIPPKVQFLSIQPVATDAPRPAACAQ